MVLLFSLSRLAMLTHFFLCVRGGTSACFGSKATFMCSAKEEAFPKVDHMRDRLWCFVSFIFHSLDFPSTGHAGID